MSNSTSSTSRSFPLPAAARGFPFAVDQFSFAYPVPQAGYYTFPATAAHLRAAVASKKVISPAPVPVAGKSVNMNLVRSLVSSKRGSGGGVRDLRISHPQSVNQQLSVDTDTTPAGSNRNSLVQQQSPASFGHQDLPGRQPQRQSQYVGQQSQQFYPTPQPNGYAFPGSIASPNMGGPTSPAFQLTTSPGFGQMPISPVDYPTPGATPISTPRYVLPSVVASQMEMDSMAGVMRSQPQSQPQPQPQHQSQSHPQPQQQIYQPQVQAQVPPPPPPPQVALNNQPDFTLSDREWQEALQAQQEYEWRMQVQKQMSGIQEQRNTEQEPPRDIRRHTHAEETLDERSFYDLDNGRRNTHIGASSSRLSAVNSYHDPKLQIQDLRRGSAPPIPKKISPEEEFYSSVNTNSSSNALAQFTPDSDTPYSPEARRLDDPPKPRSFSIDALSTNSYPVPTPVSATRKPKEQTPFSMITHRFPNWFIDGTPLPANEEDDSSHGPLAKRRRTLSDAEKDDELFWGVFYDGNGQWSRMWHRLLDGIYDYYHRMKCSDKEGLDPQTLGQMWEEMGYTVEENLYESQIRLAQSLFHPDPEDFISSLLTNYFSLLDLPHLLEQPPIQPPPSFLPKCVNPEPPVPIPLLTRDGLRRYFIHQTLLDPTLMHERFNKLLKNRPTGIVDPETSLLFVRRETGGPIIPRKTFPQQEDPVVEEVEEKVRGWMRGWVKGEIEGWVGGSAPRQPENMI